MSREIIQFLRQRDYRYVRALGRGGCGETVLLHDDIIGQHFVCKKYDPADSALKETLYEGFVNEIKLMHRAFHPNVVRIFNYYIYPRKFAGYILMEYVEGEVIDKYIKAAPDSCVAIFRQTIEAFCYLEQCGILHRDIRVQNILVHNNGTVKVIDLGFGKAIKNSADFAKSISLNWPVTTPYEFNDGKYDFCTEVYFLGKLFQGIINDNAIDDEELRLIVRQMCAPDPDIRIANFQSIKLMLDQAGFSEPKFAESDIQTYRSFADELVAGIWKIGTSATNIDDISQVISRLELAYTNSILEEAIPVQPIMNCFVDGFFTYQRSSKIDTLTLKRFLKLLKSKKIEQQRIILGNLLARLDDIERWDDEIPF